MSSNAVLDRFLPDELATAGLGRTLAAVLKRGDVIALHGDLGMGKTALARAIIRALAGNPDLEVPSPTFTLVQSYALTVPIHHFDLYRLSDESELEELGLAEAETDGIVLVEWPERAPKTFERAIHITLSEQGDGRRAMITAPTEEARLQIARSLASAP